MSAARDVAGVKAIFEMGREWPVAQTALRLVVDEPQEPEAMAAADQPAGAVQSAEERRPAERARCA